MEQQEDTFEYQVEQFADLQILRYRVPGFEKLSLRQKQLIYYLSLRQLWREETSCIIRTASTIYRSAGCWKQCMWLTRDLVIRMNFVRLRCI